MFKMNLWKSALLLVLVATTPLHLCGCFRAPKPHDDVLSSAQSPDHRRIAWVIKRNAGLLTDESILVMLSNAGMSYERGEVVLAIVGGSPPDVRFSGNQDLEIKVFGGSVHRHGDTVDGVRISLH